MANYASSVPRSAGRKDPYRRNFLRPLAPTADRVPATASRLNPNGTLDAPFDPNVKRFRCVRQSRAADGKILGGPFTSIGGQPRNN